MEVLNTSFTAHRILRMLKKMLKCNTFEKGFPESFRAAARHVKSLALSICNAMSAIFV
jgi:hypothetical protein